MKKAEVNNDNKGEGFDNDTDDGGGRGGEGYRKLYIVLQDKLKTRPYKAHGEN